MTPRLAALVRRELIRSDRPQFAGEDGFRFRHLLIRDAAYDALPKATSAELHERFAAWLEQRGDWSSSTRSSATTSNRPLATSELGQPDRHSPCVLGERPGGRGPRALGRGDERAAAGLLERALELTGRRASTSCSSSTSPMRSPDTREAAAIADGVAERATGRRREGVAFARRSPPTTAGLCRLIPRSTSWSDSPGGLCRCSSRRRTRWTRLRLVRARGTGRELGHH